MNYGGVYTGEELDKATIVLHENKVIYKVTKKMKISTNWEMDEKRIFERNLGIWDMEECTRGDAKLRGGNRGWTRNAGRRWTKL